jgi:hypothetical protein
MVDSPKSSIEIHEMTPAARHAVRGAKARSKHPTARQTRKTLVDDTLLLSVVAVDDGFHHPHIVSGGEIIDVPATRFLLLEMSMDSVTDALLGPTRIHIVSDWEHNSTEMADTELQ